MMVFPVCVKAGLPLPRLCRSKIVAEQRFEEITVGRGVATGKAAATEFKAGVPVRRWIEVLAGLPVRAQLVVGRAFFRVLEYLVGLADFLEACLGVCLLADIGMVFARQLAIGTLDFILAGSAFDSP